MSDQSNPIETPPSATAEANRLRAVFEQAARTQLPAMAAMARALIRSWAEAELAISAARRSGEPEAADLLPAEAFRTRPYQAREEVSSERITRWRGFSGQPLDDDSEARVIYREGTWFVPYPGTERPCHILGQRAVYERKTYAETVDQAEASLLFKSLSVPGVLADDVPGWHDDSPYNTELGARPGHGAVEYILARLDAIEAGPTSNRPERKHTVEHSLHGYACKPDPRSDAENVVDPARLDKASAA